MGRPTGAYILEFDTGAFVQVEWRLGPIGVPHWAWELWHGGILLDRGWDRMLVIAQGHAFKSHGRNVVDSMGCICMAPAPRTKLYRASRLGPFARSVCETGGLEGLYAVCCKACGFVGPMRMTRFMARLSWQKEAGEYVALELVVRPCEGDVDA